MPKSTSKPIRLVMSISADKMPDWHALLSKTNNGYIRAEMVRAHLKPAGSVELFPHQGVDGAAKPPVSTEPPRPQPEVQGDVDRVTDGPGKAVFEISAPAKQSSTSLSENKGLAQSPSVKSDTKNVTEAPTQRRTGSLANSLVNQGGGVKW